VGSLSRTSRSLPSEKPSFVYRLVVVVAVAVAIEAQFLAATT